MKRKTWIISALMYAAVFAACIGVLYVMKEVMKPQVQETVAESGNNVSGSGSADGADGSTGEAGVSGDGAGGLADGAASGGLASGTGESGNQQVDIKRETGYSGWKKHFPSIWQAPAEEEIPYTPPRIIIATDLHYQSAASEDDGDAIKAFVEHGDGKVVRYLPELLLWLLPVPMW